jgi:hypothetical protein
LCSFLSLVDQIEAHTHALSLVASLLRREAGEVRDRVLLPVKLRGQGDSQDSPS